MTEQLFKAIREGRAEEVGEIISTRPWLLDAEYAEGITPLRLAILCDHEHVARVLVEHGADVNAGMPAGSLPIWDAVSVGNRNLVELLIAHGAQVRGEGDAGKPLFTAAWNRDLPMTQLLIDAGADLEARDFMGNTPLQNVAWDIDARFAEALIAHCADVNARDRRGATPLMMAADTGCLESVRLLLDSGADPQLRDDTGATAITACLASDALAITTDSEGELTYHCGPNSDPPKVGDSELGGRQVVAVYDATAGRAAIVDLLLSRAGREILTIHDASLLGDIEKVQELLHSDPDLVKANTKRLGTPLHCAARLGYCDIMRLLLASGADPGSGWKEFGDTPLHTAAKHGQVYAAELLLHCGADVNARDHIDSTPLHEAVCCPEMVRLLLDRGAEANSKDADGQTPLMYALSEECEESALLLTGAGAGFDVRGSMGETPLHCAASFSPKITSFLLNIGMDVHVRDEWGKSPLMYAIENGCEETGRMVLAAGEPSVYDLVFMGELDGLKERVRSDLSLLYVADEQNHHRTLLHYAAEHGKPDIAAFLLDEGVDANVVDDRGETPLHLAAESDTAEVARLLIARGANVNATVPDDYGFTPLHEAAYHRNVEALKLLIANGADVNAHIPGGYAPLDQSESREVSMLLWRAGGIPGCGD